MADVTMTREEALKLVKALMDAAFNDNASVKECFDAREAIIAALTRPASPSDVEAVDNLEGEVIGNRELGYANGPAYERARAAVLARMRGAAVPEWRTIDSAPKDGSTILVYFKRHGWMTVSWTSDEGPESKWAHWHVDDHKHGPYPVRGYVDGDDTHWMPQPAAPEVPR